MSVPLERKAKKIADMLKILANESRLLIICALLDKPMFVSDIAKRVPNITQPALSQHLSILKSNGILDYQKQGQNVEYFVVDKRVKEVISVLREYYCK